MPFVPNSGDAAFAPQARLFAADLDVLVNGLARTGVLTGCAVTAQAVPNMTVAVAAGTAMINGGPVSVAAGNVTISAADATNPRIDLVCVDTSGTKSAIAGTPAASPVMPAIPSTSVVLAAVYVPAADAAINSNQITDKRVFPAANDLLFGNGVDGDVTIAANTTLTRDMYYRNLTVNTGVVLNAGGYRVFVAGTLTLSGTAKISRDGNNASGTTQGAALAAGTVGGGTAGGIPLSTAAGNATNALGGRGGQGGGSGAAAGTITRPVVIAGGDASTGNTPTGGPLDMLALTRGVSVTQAATPAWSVLQGGTGGGAGNTTASTSGAGGGGAGVVIVCARTVAGTGSITADGGTGGNGATNGHGGGGGGGGVAILISTSGPGTVTVTANGGAGGVKAGTGSNGVAGSNGLSLALEV